MAAIAVIPVGNVVLTPIGTFTAAGRADHLRLFAHRLTFSKLHSQRQMSSLIQAKYLPSAS
jgi:hypothetical protein